MQWSSISNISMNILLEKKKNYFASVSVPFFHGITPLLNKLNKGRMTKSCPTHTVTTNPWLGRLQNIRRKHNELKADKLQIEQLLPQPVT